MRWILISLIYISSNSLAQTVEIFSLVNVIDDKPISLEEYKKHVGVVVIFTSTKCPYDSFYINRIKDVANSNPETPVLLINSNVGESVADMKNFISKNNLAIPYLTDKVHNALNALHPRKSPECFLLKPTGDKFVVIYRGAIDDNPQTASAVNHAYLKDAIKKLIASQKIETSDVRPAGCSIKMN